MRDKMLYFAKDSRMMPVGVAAHDSHTLVIGQPGAGKTKLLDALILAALRSEESAGIVIVDPKQTGFQAWRNCGRVALFQDLAEFSNVFEAAKQEHERRTAIMREMRAESLPSGLGRVYLVVDELPALVSDATIVLKDTRQSIIDNMLLLLRLSRQTGIQLVCASQSAEGKNIISPTARGLFSNRVLMRCNNASEAEMALGMDARDLRLDTMLPGEAWVKSGSLDPVKCWVDYYGCEELAKSAAEVGGRCDFDWLRRRRLL